MKKLLIAFLLITVTMTQAFAVSDDFIAGYRQGYLDHQLGKTSLYPDETKDYTFSDCLFHIKYFVDSFGDHTAKGYISQKKYFKWYIFQFSDNKQ